MKQRWGVLLALWALGAHAAPVGYAASSTQTSAAALGATQSDAQTATDASSPPPIIATATAFGATDFASASGIGSPGLLVAESEAMSAAGFASAVGTAEFIGSFVQTNARTLLHLVFGASDFTDRTAFSGGTLFVSLSAGSTMLVSRIITAPGTYDLWATGSPGSTLSLDVLVDSESDVFTGGNASNFTSLAFQTSSVPEPSSPLLIGLAAGLAIVGGRRRRGARRAAA